jgi:hypothetical protein
MLRLNQVLTAGGCDPAHTRLLRHRHKTRQGELYSAAMEGKAQFQRYQESQDSAGAIKHFRETKWLASFVVEGISGATLFAGVWGVEGERKVPHQDDGFGASNPSGSVSFETKRVDVFDVYRGRLAIDWGGSARAWVQRADNQNKRITELRRVRQEPAFPGYAAFSGALSDAGGLPPTWSEPLRAARGIYLLVHRDSGKQYVGSACGADGFLGRWHSYADGHGGNVAMKELGHPASNFEVSILEVVGSTATMEDIIRREGHWKAKLGTRVSGLNLN